MNINPVLCEERISISGYEGIACKQKMGVEEPARHLGGDTRATGEYAAKERD